jgi:hypothetical protein
VPRSMPIAIGEEVELLERVREWRVRRRSIDEDDRVNWHFRGGRRYRVLNERDGRWVRSFGSKMGIIMLAGVGRCGSAAISRNGGIGRGVPVSIVYRVCPHGNDGEIWPMKGIEARECAGLTSCHV